MAGTFFKFNAQTLASTINKGVQQISDTKSLMEAVGEALTSGAKNRFADETAPDGTKWVKGKKGRGKTLAESGTLRKSITYNAGITEVEYGTNMVYGATHQFGRGGTPARPFIGISKEDEAEIKEMVAQHMQDALCLRKN